MQSGVHHMEWLSRVLIRVSACTTTKHIQATVFLVLSGISTTVLLNPPTNSLSSSNTLVTNTQSNTIKKSAKHHCTLYIGSFRTRSVPVCCYTCRCVVKGQRISKSTLIVISNFTCISYFVVVSILTVGDVRYSSI